MIKIENGSLKIEGAEHQILSETTIVLKTVYRNMKDRQGEKYAKEQMALMGRLAVATPEEIAEDMVRVATGKISMFLEGMEGDEDGDNKKTAE